MRPCAIPSSDHAGRIRPTDPQIPFDPASAHAPDQSDPRRALGQLGEQIAVAHLERRGFAILDRNVRTCSGEIDIIAFDGSTLAFVEVKTRRARKGMPPEIQPLLGLRFSQRTRLRRLAHAWLYEATPTRPRAETIRFDAVGVTVDGTDRLLRLDHLEGAW